MKLDFCAVCGSTSDLHQHHLEPVVLTGAKRAKAKGYSKTKPIGECTSFEVFAYLFDLGIITDDGTITVCSFHHNILHGIIKFQKAEHNKLVREGIQKAKERGVQFGRPSKLTPDMFQRIKDMREKNFGIKKIARHLKIGVGTVYSAMEQIESGIIEELMKKKMLEENPANFLDLV
jgi:hypothetical protein